MYEYFIHEYKFQYYGLELVEELECALPIVDVGGGQPRHGDRHLRTLRTARLGWHDAIGGIASPTHQHSSFGHGNVDGGSRSVVPNQEALNVFVGCAYGINLENYIALRQFFAAVGWTSNKKAVNCRAIYDNPNLLLIISATSFARLNSSKITVALVLKSPQVVNRSGSVENKSC